MKKFLSVLLTMAMVLTLFSGTVLAAPVTVVANPTHVDLNAGKPLVLGAGTIVEVITGDNQSTPYSHTWSVQNSAGITVYTGPAKVTSTVVAESGGTYEHTFTYNISNVDIRIAANAVQSQYKLVRDVNPAKTFQVLRQMSINGSEDNPSVKPNVNFSFSGNITGGSTNMSVALVDSLDEVLTQVQVQSDGTFNFGYQINTVGTYNIVVVGSADANNYYIYKTLKFVADENLLTTVTKAPVTLNQMNVLGEDEISISVTAKADAKNLTADLQSNVVFQIKYPNGDLYELVKPTTSVKGTDNRITYKLTDYKLKKISGDYVAGTYTVSTMKYGSSPAIGANTKLTQLESATVIQSRKAEDVTFTIVDNLSVLFSSIDINGNKTGIYPTGTDSLNIALTAPSTKTIVKTVVKVSGPIAGGEKSKTEDTLPANFSVPFVLNGAGKVEVKGTVTYSDKTTEEFEATLTVSGYVAEVTPEETLGEVGEEVTLKAIVKTSGGVLVNNAIVKWEAFEPGSLGVLGKEVKAFYPWNTTEKVFEADAVDTITVSGQASVISEGTYSRLVKLAKYADIRVTVTNGTTATYQAYSSAKLFGKSVYEVEEIKDLIATKSQTISIKMKDDKGNSVQPVFIAVDDSDTPNILKTNPTSFGSYDGATGKVTLVPEKTGKFTLLVGTDKGDKVGKVEINVVAPEVTVLVNGVESQKITAGFRDKVELVFADSAASVVKYNPTIKTDTLDGAFYDAASLGAVLASNQSTVSGKLVMYPEYAIYKNVEKGAVPILVSYNAGTDFVEVAKLEVLHPILSFDIEELEVGSVVDVELTLTDANGKPLEDYEIKATDNAAFAGNPVVETDEDGKAVMTVSPTAVGRLSLEVQGIESVYDKTAAKAVNYVGVLPVVRDLKGPDIIMEEVYIVATPTATVSFKVVDNNMRNMQVWIDNEQVIARRDGTVNFTVSGLKIGENKFEISAFDEFGNQTDAVLVIKYSIPTKYELTIGSTEATKDGAPIVGMDQAPVIKGGRTFLPVRFVLETLMGGTMEWDANTRTITAVVDGHNIKMVIGSKVAWVDSAEIELLEAPYIESASSRTLVPLREIMEAIGYVLEWDAVTRTATILVP